MTFEKALEAMKQGKIVKYKKGTIKYVYNPDGKKYQALISPIFGSVPSEDFFFYAF